MKTPFYFGYGTLILALLGWAEYGGYSFLSVSEVKNVPKSVRNNPGAYRSHYRSGPRYFGGK
jgi:hypothetical protein